MLGAWVNIETKKWRDEQFSRMMKEIELCARRALAMYELYNYSGREYDNSSRI